MILGFYTSGRDAGAHGIFPRKATNKQLRRIDIFNITLSSILMRKNRGVQLAVVVLAIIFFVTAKEVAFSSSTYEDSKIRRHCVLPLFCFLYCAFNRQLNCALFTFS